MRLLSEAARAAGNVLLTPVTPPQLGSMHSWRRARLVGSRNQAFIAQATRELKQIAPSIVVDAPGACPGRHHDVVCLLLTGEGLSAEKVAALLSRSPTIIARGGEGRWYRVNLPPVQPASIRWWLRLALACLLSLLYQSTTATVIATDLLRKLAPVSRLRLHPGVPAGRTVKFIVPTYNQRQLMDFCLPPLLAEAKARNAPAL